MFNFLQNLDNDISYAQKKQRERNQQKNKGIK